MSGCWKLSDAGLAQLGMAGKLYSLFCSVLTSTSRLSLLSNCGPTVDQPGYDGLPLPHFLPNPLASQPSSTTCSYCWLDRLYTSPSMSLVDRPIKTNVLMEYTACMRVVHPTCETDYGVEGIISIMPNQRKQNLLPPAKTVKLEQDVGGADDKDQEFLLSVLFCSSGCPCSLT